MLDRRSPPAEEIIRETTEAWIAAFAAALQAKSGPALSELFAADSHWRNLFGISWHFATFSGRQTLAEALLQHVADAGATGFRLDPAALTPRRAVVAGREVIEAIFAFDTDNGPGIGAVRLLPEADGRVAAWTISTSLDFNRICEARANASAESHTRDFAGPDWSEQRQASATYDHRDPDVLIVGGGHAGISAAVELKRIGLDALIVDRMARVGDNWRLRYRGLKLHNKTPVNHLRYLPFPATFPDYIPKDKIANWLESYVDIMEVDFWTQTSFDGADYDDATQRWSARLTRADGTAGMLKPKHIVLATSVSGTPNIPVIDGIENFKGETLHSSRFAAGKQWAGRSVIVFGTGTSSHDICQELQAAGADVTMVQRSPTMVVNVEPAQLYDKTYLGDGPPVEIRDLLNTTCRCLS